MLFVLTSAAFKGLQADYVCNYIISMAFYLLYYNTIYCKLFKDFADQLVLRNKIACAVGLGHARLLSNHKSFQQTT